MNTNDPSKQESSQPAIEIDDIIGGLTLSFAPKSRTSYDMSSFELEDQLGGAIQYEEIEIDSEMEAKVQELKLITDSIEQKLIDPRAMVLAPKNYKIDYKQELNPQQLSAVVTTHRPLLVIAGAGSGKTRVITYKVSYLLENGLEAGQILLLTFTRKAANEMLERVQKLLGPKSTNGTLGGTFHSFANHVLRKYSILIGVPSNFTIIDTGDAEDIISLLKTELGLSGKKGGKQFPKSAKIQTIISKSKNLELSLPETIKRCFPDNVEHTASIELIQRALVAYKKASNLFDYDDLIEILRDKLRDNQTFRTRLQQSIKYILVDEYQDTNNIQREIVEYIAGRSGRITVVGDDAQSIYAFRGANFENILRFPQTFPDCCVVKIEENYRSEQGILDFSNDIIDSARIGFKKKLFSSRHIGKKPVVRRFADATLEAEYIANKILEGMNNSLSYSDFAVLTRSSWNSNYVQAELIKRNIPFKVVGGIRFSERRHIKDVIAFLKILLNPMDAVAWHRVLKLVEGVGEVRAKEIITVIHAHGGVVDFRAFSNRQHYKGLYELEVLFRKLMGANLSPAALICEISAFYKPILKQIEEDHESREIDLEIFSEIAAKYEELEKFLSDFTLEPPSNRWQDKALAKDGDGDAVVISTIHSAKGLEWHTVFIPFALDGIMPSVRSLGSVHEVEEERRLFYVAASRAKENLYITMPAYVSSYDSFFTKPSRFLQEVGREKYQIEK